MDFVKKIKIGRGVDKLKASRSLSADELHALKAQLVAAGASAIRPTIRALGVIDARPHAREVLEELLNDDSVGLFVEALSESNHAVVASVSKILAQSRSYDASMLLLEFSNPNISKPALESILTERASDIPPQKLLAQLSGADKDVRAKLLRLLDQAVDQSVMVDLLPILDSEDLREQLLAIRMLARFDDQQVVDGFVRLLDHENGRVRLECVAGLQGIGARTAVPHLVRLLRDPNLKVQSAVIDALMHLGDASTVPELLQVLTDESEHARRGAVEVLNEVATTEAIQDLLRALHDADWWVRVRAADALGTLGGERVVEAVIGLLDDSEDFIRRYAVEILNTVPHERAVKPLIYALQDADWWVRERSIDALGNIGDDTAVEPLIDLMLQDPQATPLCAGALGKIGDARAVEPLLGLLESDREEVTREATRALQQLFATDLTDELKATVREAIGNVRLPSGPSASTSAARNPESQAPPAVHPSVRAEASDLRPRSSGHVPERGASVSRSAAGSTPRAQPPNSRLDFGNLADGTVLLDRYEVVRSIGKGGFGAVYLVRDAAIDEEVILKILNPQMSTNEDELRRFIQELKLTRKITHKHVIRIFDFLDLGGAHAVSMEYFPGRDLSKILVAEGALGPRRTLKIVSQICEGLEAAHDVNVIHRDVKPANVVVDADDMIKIVDFGLAWAQQRAGSRLTKSGLMIGTPEYMAPELVRGDEEIGCKADIYSLGIMMYEMLAGRRPFAAETPVKVLFLHLEGEVTPLGELAPEASPGLEQLVGAAMARDVAHRPADVRKLRAMVEMELAALSAAQGTTHGSN